MAWLDMAGLHICEDIPNALILGSIWRGIRVQEANTRLPSQAMMRKDLTLNCITTGGFVNENYASIGFRGDICKIKSPDRPSGCLEQGRSTRAAILRDLHHAAAFDALARHVARLLFKSEFVS